MSDESPTTNGIAHIFSKSQTRSKKDRSSGSNSIASTGTGTESDGRRGVRESLEGVVDKLKMHHDNEESGDNGLKKLLPKSIGSKRRQKRQEKEEEQRLAEEAARGRSIADRGTLENETRDSLSRQFSSNSTEGDETGDELRDRRSSMITIDSDPESLAHTPPLTSHPSHIGYLTTSSPLVHSTTFPNASSAQGQLDGQNTHRAATFSIDNLAASDTTPTLLTSSTLQAPTDGSQQRSPSPGRRLKEALRPGRKGASPASSPERKAGLEQPQKEKVSADTRRGSVASRIGAIFPDRQSPQSQPASTKSSSPDRRPRTASGSKIKAIDTTAIPQTPPQTDGAPIIVNTPPTPTDSSVPRFSDNRSRGSSDPITKNPNVITSPSGNMISHRRVQSGSMSLGPSKLSNITSAPLTPTLENGSTTPNSQSGFFSSVFSAAQNAANTLSNSIANTSVAPGKNKSSLQEIKEPESPEVETLGEKEDSNQSTEQKELAVKTLGMGDLSLSHLGISETSSGANTPTTSKFPEEPRGRSETIIEDAYNNRSSMPATGVPDSNGDFAAAPEVEDVSAVVRPRSFYENSMAGDHTPPNGSVFEGKAGITRSGSIRSAMGNRRKRGSSAATGASGGTTIGAAIAAAHSSMANPTANGSTPKITGFAVASKKRNRDFHQLFRSVPDDDYLIEDYSCALQREILAHGRLYVSEGHLCFSSNIFGWVTTLVMSFDEIVSVEKRSTALLFKNGLMISTLHAKNVFASFTSRDSTYDLIVGIWKLGHPSLRSSLNGVRIEETGGGDKTEKDDGGLPGGSQSGSESESDDGEGDEMYDEDEDDDDAMSYTQNEGSVAGSEIAEKAVSRKPSAAITPSGNLIDKKEDATGPPVIDFPGPATHGPTDCTEPDTHYAKVIADEFIPAPLGKVYNMMFGPASLVWMKNWLTVEQKCLELTLEDDAKKPLGLDNKVRHYSYIKPLNGSIGPKQTKCVCTETLDALDLEKSVSVTISTQTPDVPSGNVFSTKTKYCLSWAEGNGTRLQMNCAIEWTGKSWLKGPIEKGANDGQVLYAKDIAFSLKSALSSRRPTPVTVGKKRRGRKLKEAKASRKQIDGSADSDSKAVSWGVFEPVRPILGPLADIVSPLMSGNMMYGLLVGLLVASWFGFGLRGNGSSDMSRWGPGLGTPERMAAYEEMWRSEESELWKWLEDRVGMDHLRNVAMGEERAVRDKLKDERMAAREVDHAIRVTEERLRVLKGVVEKEKVRAMKDAKVVGKDKDKERDAPVVELP